MAYMTQTYFYVKLWSCNALSLIILTNIIISLSVTDHIYSEERLTVNQRFWHHKVDQIICTEMNTASVLKGSLSSFVCIARFNLFLCENIAHQSTSRLFLLRCFTAMVSHSPHCKRWIVITVLPTLSQCLLNSNEL